MDNILQGRADRKSKGCKSFRHSTRPPCSRCKAKLPWLSSSSVSESKSAKQGLSSLTVVDFDSNTKPATGFSSIFPSGKTLPENMNKKSSEISILWYIQLCKVKNYLVRTSVSTAQIYYHQTWYSTESKAHLLWGKNFSNRLAGYTCFSVQTRKKKMILVFKTCLSLIFLMLIRFYEVNIYQKVAMVLIFMTYAYRLIKLWLTDWLTDWLTNWLRFIAGSACQLTGWLNEWLRNGLINWLTYWLTGKLTDWPTDWLTGLLTD